VKFNVQNTKLPKNPIPLSIYFYVIANDENQKDEPKDFPYRELIGSLMFAATVSHPDIAHAINKLAQYSSNPSIAHWNLAKQILKYVYHTCDQTLTLGGENFSLHAYSDADFAKDTKDRKLISEISPYF
jgi:hypothetical protein